MTIKEVVFEGTEYQGWGNWADKFKPTKNQFSKDPNEHMFETFGEEYEYVKTIHENFVWTWVQGDLCDIIVAGRSYVNRLGYYVTELPWDNEWDSCLLSVQLECECYDEDAWESGDPDCQKCESSGYVTNYVS